MSAFPIDTIMTSERSYRETAHTSKSSRDLKLAILNPSIISSTMSNSENVWWRDCMLHLRFVGSSADISGSPSPAAEVLEAGDDVRDLLEPLAAVDATAVSRSIVR